MHQKLKKSVLAPLGDTAVTPAHRIPRLSSESFLGAGQEAPQRGPKIYLALPMGVLSGDLFQQCRVVQPGNPERKQLVCAGLWSGYLRILEVEFPGAWSIWNWTCSG